MIYKNFISGFFSVFYFDFSSPLAFLVIHKTLQCKKTLVLAKMTSLTGEHNELLEVYGQVLT